MRNSQIKTRNATQRGVSILETIIVLAVTSLMMVLVYHFYSKSSNDNKLKAAVEQVSNLNEKIGYALLGNLEKLCDDNRTDDEMDANACKPLTPSAVATMLETYYDFKPSDFKDPWGHTIDVYLPAMPDGSTAPVYYIRYQNLSVDNSIYLSKKVPDAEYTTILNDSLMNDSVALQAKIAAGGLASNDTQEYLIINRAELKKRLDSLNAASPDPKYTQTLCKQGFADAIIAQKAVCDAASQTFIEYACTCK